MSVFMLLDCLVSKNSVQFQFSHLTLYLQGVINMKILNLISIIKQTGDENRQIYHLEGVIITRKCTKGEMLIRSWE